MTQRPKLTKRIAVEDFRSFYWFKSELIEFCRNQGLSSQGGKLDIATRIELFLSTGTIEPQANKQQKVSNFDWNTETLSLDTIITDSYKNTQNVRDFFTRNIGPGFKFNVSFMDWMKSNTGKTLQDAIDEYDNILSRNKTRSTPKEIAPQFEYNRYIRDFMKDNPDASRNEAIKHWHAKKKKRGDNRYNRSDLKSGKN